MKLSSFSVQHEYNTYFLGLDIFIPIRCISIIIFRIFKIHCLNFTSLQQTEKYLKMKVFRSIFGINIFYSEVKYFIF